MKRSILATAVLLGTFYLQATDAFSFDGKRKGFILGLGIGGGLNSHKMPELLYDPQTNRFSTLEERQSNFAFMSDFKIGYAPTHSLLLYWNSKVAWFSLEAPSFSGGSLGSKSVTATSGIGGLGMAYYLNEQGPSPYLTATVGFASWSIPFESGAESLYSTGVALGGGFEFSNHWSLEGAFSFGSPKKDEDEVNTFAVRITLNVLAY